MQQEESTQGENGRNQPKLFQPDPGSMTNPKATSPMVDLKQDSFHQEIVARMIRWRCFSKRRLEGVSVVVLARGCHDVVVPLLWSSSPRVVMSKNESIGPGEQKASIQHGTYWWLVDNDAGPCCLYRASSCFSFSCLEKSQKPLRSGTVPGSMSLLLVALARAQTRVNDRFCSDEL